MTVIEELIKSISQEGILSQNELLKKLEILKEKEKKQILDAIIYSLDEDGHTGDWKIKFAKNYYENLSKK